MAQQSSTATDRWGKPLPRKLTLKSGKVVTEQVYDKSQYHDNCRACGGDVFGQPIWYVKRTEANVTPKHVTCPTVPTPNVEQARPATAPAVKSQSVYAQRRDQYAQPSRQQADHEHIIVAGGLTWEVE